MEYSILIPLNSGNTKEDRTKIIIISHFLEKEHVTKLKEVREIVEEIENMDIDLTKTLYYRGVEIVFIPLV